MLNFYFFWGGGGQKQCDESSDSEPKTSKIWDGKNKSWNTKTFFHVKLREAAKLGEFITTGNKVIWSFDNIKTLLFVCLI